MFKAITPYTLLMLLSLSALLSCEVSGPGDGGTSQISGSLLVHDYDKEGNLKGIYAGYDEKVYLSYGQHNYIDDETRTGADGTFRFSFLRNGDYTITVYTKCDSCVQDEVGISQRVQITSKNTEYLLDEIVVRR